MYEPKPESTQELEFEQRVKSMSAALFGIFGPPESCDNDRKDQIFVQILLYKSEIFERNFHAYTKLVLT